MAGGLGTACKIRCVVPLSILDISGLDWISPWIYIQGPLNELTQVQSTVPFVNHVPSTRKELTFKQKYGELRSFFGEIQYGPGLKPGSPPSRALEARAEPGPGSPSRAGPDSGLERAWGLGFKSPRPEPGPEARACALKNSWASPGPGPSLGLASPV
ncbi:hypothetical protein C8R43DRAFT_1108844 [Mycena crocata]|nr:hypothetical protein C8R43DRAFT_1108844 [Mycena crocata]